MNLTHNSFVDFVQDFFMKQNRPKHVDQITHACTIDQKIDHTLVFHSHHFFFALTNNHKQEAQLIK